MILRWTLSLLVLVLSIAMTLTLNVDIKGVDFTIGLIAGITIMLIHVVLKIGIVLTQQNRDIMTYRDLLRESVIALYQMAPGHSLVKMIREALKDEDEGDDDNG